MMSLGFGDLTLREQVGQAVILPISQPHAFAEHDGIAAFLERYPVGGFTVKPSAIPPDHPDPAVGIRELIAELQAGSRVPLCIVEDFEQGAGQFVPGCHHFPPVMGMVATGDPDLAYAYGRAIAAEAGGLAYHVLIHPCVDLNRNRHNPVTSVRSVGDDVERALPLLRAQLRGIQDAGLAATIKHFPGDGVDWRDQHLVTTCNSLPREIWWEQDGRLFQTLIDDGACCVMPGHIALPWYQGAGSALPATLDGGLIDGLLKREMGFTGVVISDALGMGGFCGGPDDLAARQVAAFHAGVDILLWPELEVFDLLEDQVREGVLPRQRLADAGARIVALKRRLGLFAPGGSEPRPYDRQAVVDAHRRLSSAAITLERDRCGLLPVKPGRRVLVVALFPDLGATHLVDDHGLLVGNANVRATRTLAEGLRSHGVEVTYLESAECVQRQHHHGLLADHDLCLVIGGGRPHFPVGTLAPYHHEARAIWRLNNGVPGDRMLFIGLGDPYLGRDYFPHASSVIQAYGNAPATIEEVLAVLTGRSTPRGVLPLARSLRPDLR